MKCQHRMLRFGFTTRWPGIMAYVCGTGVAEDASGHLGDSGQREPGI